MYQFISALSRESNGSGVWVNRDISDIPLNILLSLYSRILVTLSNHFLPDNVVIDLGVIIPNVSGNTLTLNEFLIKNDNNTLATIDIALPIKEVTAKYADAFKAGYNIIPISPDRSVTSTQPAIDKDWLYLTKPTLNYDLFYKSCLVNVNGFFHLTDTDGTGIYVIDGMKTARKSNHNQIGIYSFAELGSIKLIPIKSNMVYKQRSEQPYSNAVFIDSGVDFTNKTVMLVLGGYLHLMDDRIFNIINDTAIKVNFNETSLLNRYFDSKKYLDFKTLPLSHTKQNENQISITEFFSDENLLAYLTLSQSFIVILDNPDVFITKSPLRKTPYGDMFISYEKPLWPLVVKTGKIINYWSTFEDGQYSITATDTMELNYNYDTVDINNAYSVDNSVITVKPNTPSDAYFLKINTLNI